MVHFGKKGGPDHDRCLSVLAQIYAVIESDACVMTHPPPSPPPSAPSPSPPPPRLPPPPHHQYGNLTNLIPGYAYAVQAPG